MPEIRANHSKHLMGRIKRLPEPSRGVALGAIGTLRDEIRAAGLFDWLPAERHVRLSDGVVEALGRHAAQEFWRDVLLDGFARALLRPLVSGALGVYGKTPLSLLRLSPHAWTLVTRDCGMLEFERSSDNSARMRFRELPPVVERSAGMLAFFHGGLESTYSYFRCRGRVALVERAAREIDFQVEWTPGSA